MMEAGYKLDADEQVIRRVNRHWIALAPVIVSVAVIVLIIVGGSYLIARFHDQIPKAVPTSALAGLMAILLAIAAFIFLVGIWVYRRNFILLTTKHLIRVEQRGLFARSVSQLSLSRVQDVSSSVPGMLATILGFGNVTVQTAGEEDNFVFTMMPRPADIAESCIDAHDRYGIETPVMPQAPSPAPQPAPITAPVSTENPDL